MKPLSDFDWDEVQAALKALKEHTEITEPYAVNFLSDLDGVLEGLPDEEELNAQVHFKKDIRQDSAHVGEIRGVRVLLYLDEDRWLAQGLQYDICVRATAHDSYADVFRRFCTAFDAERADGTLSKINPAPKKFFDLEEQIKKWAAGG